MHAIIVVLQLPLKESLKRRVSLESRKGICKLLLLYWSDLCDRDPETEAFWARAAIQLPSAAIDLLIFLASASLSISEPLLLNLSEPAKSTIVNNAFL